MEIGDPSRGGAKRDRVLCIDAALDCVAPKLHVLLGDRERRAGRNPDLLVDEIEPGDHLGHGMLDLDARVHFDEIELAVLVQELDRTGAAIAEIAHGLRARPHRCSRALFRIERGGGAFLPDLLMPALQRAIAFAQMDCAAAAVAENLDLDVPGLFEVFFKIDRIVAEGGFGFGARSRKGIDEIALGSRDLHAAPAAAGSGLDQDGIADLRGDALCVVIVVDAALRAGHAGDAEARCRALCLDLVAHEPDMFGSGPDKRDLMFGQYLREARVFGRKP